MTIGTIDQKQSNNNIINENVVLADDPFHLSLSSFRFPDDEKSLSKTEQRVYEGLRHRHDYGGLNVRMKNGLISVTATYPTDIVNFSAKDKKQYPLHHRIRGWVSKTPCQKNGRGEC